MKRVVAVVLLTLTGVSPLRANLGDSADKIDVSYEKVVARHLRDDGTVSVRYQKDRYVYLVIFDHLRSVSESYSRMDGRDLSPKEIAKFLRSNSSGGATWTPRDTSSNERKFERSDHKAKASYANMEGRPTLTVRALGGRSRVSDVRHPTPDDKNGY
jgi:hypothetical protein